MVEVIKEFMQKGYLLDRELAKIVDNENLEGIFNEFSKILVSFQPGKIISQDFFFLKLPDLLNQLETKKSLTIGENKELFIKAIDYLSKFIKKPETTPEKEETKPEKEREKEREKEKEKKAREEEKFFRGVRILESFNIENRKIVVEDFVRYFRDRYNTIKLFLQEHDLRNLTSINKLSSQRQNISIIGLVYNKHHTKNKNLLLEIEDPTGKITVLVSKEKEELFEKAKQIVLDEVIAINCSGSRDIVFANDIIFPEAVLKERKKYDKEEYAIFTADLHIGSNKFLEENFLKFVKWLNGELGNEKQIEIAKKIKYLFVVGDLVDGVGIYPNQESELVIKDIYEQYEKAAELFSKIRKDIIIIMCPGNHDAVRIVEPQPRFDSEIAEKLYELPNVMILTNPCVVNIASSKNFSGYNIFMYHGASFDEYGNDVEILRLNQAFKRPELILHFLLNKRHVAPTHASTRYFPCEKDSLVIRTVPDIFVSAHIHKSSISHYNNIVVISCSCWQSKTPYQEKFGHEPDPCKVPIFDLKTGKINVIDFS